jgi:hypothetical protein
MFESSPWYCSICILILNPNLFFLCIAIFDCAAARELMGEFYASIGTAIIEVINKTVDGIVTIYNQLFKDFGTFFRYMFVFSIIAWYPAIVKAFCDGIIKAQQQ